MSVATASALLMTDGDAAFVRVNNRAPAHALQAGEVARAVNCRFDRGKPGPRYGVALDAWGVPGNNLVSGAFADTFGLGPYPIALAVTLVPGSRYFFFKGNADDLSTLPGASIDPSVIIAPGIFTATQATYYLLTSGNAEGQTCTSRIVRVGRTCGYRRFSDPFSATDNAVLLTDDWRDGAGEDGGRGRAWRILPENILNEIPLNGHDIWGTARLVQCGNAMLLLRHGNQRYYFSASAVNDATNDSIQLNVTPPWAVNTGRRVRFELATAGSAIYGTAPPAAGNYYFAKHITGDKIELYSDEALTNKLNYAASPAPSGAFFIEEAITPDPFFGNGARPLLAQPSLAGSPAFEAGFDWVLENVEITDTSASADNITAPNHRFSPGDSVTGTAIGGVTWPKFAAPQSAHTLRLYATADDAMVDSGRTIAFSNTALATDRVTATSHGLVTGDRVYASGITGLTSETLKYVNVVDANTLKLYDTAANALAGGGSGLFDLTVNSETGTLTSDGLVNLTTGGETGSIWKTNSASVPLPPCREGAYINGRFIGINGRDLIIISDPNDFLHCSIWQGVLPANQGESGVANWLLPLGDNVVAVGKDLNVIGIAGLAGDSTGWSERIITAEYNGLAPLAALPFGSDILFASRKGLASVIRTVAGETLGTARTVSHSIPEDLKDIDWSRASLQCAEVWNNRLFWSVPTRSQTPAEGEDPVNNKTLVLNFLNSKLRVNQTVLAGDIMGGIVETDAGEDSWEGYWEGDMLTPYAYAKLTVGGEERLTFATPDGLVCWFHDGSDDLGADFANEVLTRGYFGGRPVLALKGKLCHDTFQPSITATLVSAGVNEEVNLAGFNPLTYDRLKYTFANTADYDPASASEEGFNRRGRQDYSPTDEDLSVATLDQHQNLTEPFYCRERCVAPQIRYVNTQGSARLCAVALQARPTGLNGRET